MHPLTCPKCKGRMHVIVIVDDEVVIRKILTHLNLWNVKRKLPPCAHAPPIDGFPIYEEPQAPSAGEYLIDPDYPAEAHF
ncbi:MAG: hypothetical protein QF466_08380 [Desulfobacterales bacterium]|nr:hypothetical protein [Desulfobacterales bacterium]